MTTGSGGPVAPPGWYPDGEGWERRWDGAAWTEERRPVAAAGTQGQTSDEPPVGAPAEASPMDGAEATVVRPGPAVGGDATVMSAKPPLPPTPAPEEAIWPADPVTATPEPEQAIWPADPDRSDVREAGPVPPPAAAATQVGPLGRQGAPQPPPAPHAAPNAAAPAQPWSPPPPPPPPSSGGTGAPAYPYGQPGGYATPPPPPGGKKSLLWLWIVLAVVLVVLAGAAVTLVVTKPWDDESSTTADGNDGGDGGEGGEEEVPEPVTGDIDGDGRGDAIADLTNDSKTFRITLTSTGTSFDVEEKVIPAHEQLVWGDFDGDGALEVLSWTADGSTFSITSEDGSFPEASATVDLWRRAPEMKAHVGDYDGDGLDDVAVHGQVDQESVGVWVLRSNGEGFDQAAQWLTLDNTTWGSTSLFGGDWDADGTDDLLALVPTKPLEAGDYDSGFYDGKMGAALMRSDGSSFQPGSVSPLPGDAQIHQSDLVLGDFTGEGTPMIAVEDDVSQSVKVYEYDGTGLVAASGLEVGFIGEQVKGGIEAIGASDVDGDGKDDVVFVTYDFGSEQYEGFLVARSTGTGFSAVEVWAETPECKDFCYMEFEQGS